MTGPGFLGCRSLGVTGAASVTVQHSHVLPHCQILTPWVSSSPFRNVHMEMAGGHRAAQHLGAPAPPGKLGGRRQELSFLLCNGQRPVQYQKVGERASAQFALSSFPREIATPLIRGRLSTETHCEGEQTAGYYYGEMFPTPHTSCGSIYLEPHPWTFSPSIFLSEVIAGRCL